MTQPPRRPTEPVFHGATSIPTPRSDLQASTVDVPTVFLQHPPPPPPPQQNKNNQQQHRHRSRPARLIRSVRAAFRSFPILPAPSCRGLPSLPHLPSLNGGGIRFHGSTRTTGTLYGRRRSRITVAFHDSPASPPGLLLEMCVATAKFIQDVSAAGMVRVTLECDKKNLQQYQQSGDAAALPARRLLDEPTWAAEVNGESVGYASRREATEEDERVMRLLHATSMGAGVLPEPDDMLGADPANGELTYMRAHFDRVVGSKDSETYYMHNPEGTATGPELTIFFIRN